MASLESTTPILPKLPNGYIDLTGQTFGRLHVIARAPSRNRRAYFVCHCVCGTSVTVTGHALRSHNTQSCGCKRVETLAQKLFRHGAARRGKQTLEYQSWYAMMQRCYNANNRRYHRYGGRGIVVDEAWHEFARFLADMGHRPSPHYSLDRINNNRGYAPDNCRWATAKEQTRNTSRNVHWTFQGETHCIIEWSAILHIPYSAIKVRLKYGWSIERILTTPVRASHHLM